MDDDDLEELEALEKRLCLPAGFIRDLRDESDWGFIIKLHALFEAAITHLVVAYLGKPELIDVASRVPLSDSKTGKLAILSHSDTIDDEHKRFIKSLSELRNSLIHDITNTSFSLQAHIALCDRKKLQQFARHFHIPGWYQPDLADTDLLKTIAENPRLYLFQGACGLLNWLSNIIRWEEHDREMERFGMKFLSDYVANNQPDEDDT